MTPDTRWLPFCKMGFGYALLIIVGGLSMAISLGKVEEHTSYGLGMIVGCLTTLAGGFAQWAFGGPKKSADDAPRVQP